MARRSNGGIIGKYNPVSGTSASGVFSVNEAAAYAAVGQFPVGTIVNVSAPLVEQIGTALKPTITSVVYTDNNYRELSAGANTGPVTGASLRIRGQNFFPNTRIYVNGNTVNTTNKYVNSTEIRTANIVLAAGAYTLMAFNTSNIGSIYTPGIQFRAIPVWITNPTLASANVNANFSYTLSSSDATPVVYSLAEGSTLPANTALSSTGIFSGNVADASHGTYSFTVNLTNVYGLIVPRTFTIRFTTVYSATYLVVAGGGGGGRGRSGGGGGGGGGAGGLLTGSIPLFNGTAYTINVGAGGVAGSTPVPTPQWNGANSSISGSSITTITSVGGGGGASDGIVNPGQPGGSGGGGGGGRAGTFPGGAATNYPGPAQQGFPGGTNSSVNDASGGGGGATSVGGNATTSSGGNGGAGYTWPITGLTYAGGGGGGGIPAQGLGGGGGGGNAGATGTAGTPGLGGGGGGAPGTPNTNPGYAGGSGTVILAVPTSNFPGAAPGATVTTPPAAPGMTVLTYTTPSPDTPATFTYTG
jgi:hypothetical protein